MTSTKRSNSFDDLIDTELEGVKDGNLNDSLPQMTGPIARKLVGNFVIGKRSQSGDLSVRNNHSQANLNNMPSRGFQVARPPAQAAIGMKNFVPKSHGIRIRVLRGSEDGNVPHHSRPTFSFERRFGPSFPSNSVKPEPVDQAQVEKPKLKPDKCSQVSLFQDLPFDSSSAVVLDSGEYRPARPSTSKDTPPFHVNSNHMPGMRVVKTARGANFFGSQAPPEPQGPEGKKHLPAVWMPNFPVEKRIPGPLRLRVSKQPPLHVPAEDKYGAGDGGRANVVPNTRVGGLISNNLLGLGRSTAIKDGSRFPVKPQVGVLGGLKDVGEMVRLTATKLVNDLQKIESDLSWIEASSSNRDRIQLKTDMVERNFMDLLKQLGYSGSNEQHVPRIKKQPEIPDAPENVIPFSRIPNPADKPELTDFADDFIDLESSSPRKGPKTQFKDSQLTLGFGDSAIEIEDDLNKPSMNRIPEVKERSLSLSQPNDEEILPEDLELPDQQKGEPDTQSQEEPNPRGSTTYGGGGRKPPESESSDMDELPLDIPVVEVPAQDPLPIGPVWVIKHTYSVKFPPKDDQLVDMLVTNDANFLAIIGLGDIQDEQRLCLLKLMERIAPVVKNADFREIWLQILDEHCTTQTKLEETNKKLEEMLSLISSKNNVTSDLAERKTSIETTITRLIQEVGTLSTGLTLLASQCGEPDKKLSGGDFLRGLFGLSHSHLMLQTRLKQNEQEVQTFMMECLVTNPESKKGPEQEVPPEIVEIPDGGDKDQEHSVMPAEDEESKLSEFGLEDDPVALPDQGKSDPSADPPVGLEIPQPVTKKPEVMRDHMGEYPRIIHGLSRSYNIYDQEKLEGQVQNSFGDILIENCDWRSKHIHMESPFSDRGFGCTLSTLKGYGKTSEAGEAEKLSKYDEYVFDRLPKVKPDTQVMLDNVSFHDVSQGGLGDCYFLSSLASAARYPHRVERAIMQRTNSTTGAYCVAMCITGSWVTVIVDDYFPVRKDGVLPFCEPRNKVFWPLLFEKAYAKVYGAYWHIGHGGQAKDALRDITGAPTEHIDLKDAKVESGAMEKIRQAENNNFIVNVSSKGKGEEKNENGIITGHGYSMLGLVTLSNGVELLKLRNPWGKGEWLGAWSDKSELWTDEFKREAGWVDEDDGVFFITYEDFKQNFEAFTIAHYHDDYYYSSLSTRNNKGATDRMQFTVPEKGKYYVGVSQPSKMKFPNDTAFEYGYISCVVLRRAEKGGFEYVGGVADKDRDPWCVLDLEPGDYVALIYTNWKNHNTEYTFWTYGVKNTIIKNIMSWTNRTEKVLNDVLTAKSRSTTDKWDNHFPDKVSQVPRCRSKMEQIGGYGYYIFENMCGGDRVFEVKLTKTSNNSEFIFPQEGGDEVNFKIKTGESRLALYRISDLPHSVSFKSSFSL